MKAWCIWCEDGDKYPPMYKRNGMVWIHEKYANQLMDINQDIKSKEAFTVIVFFLKLEYTRP